MKTDTKDFLYSGALIGLVLVLTGGALWALSERVQMVFGAFSGLALFVVAALAYGGFTAALLAIVLAWQPLHEGEYTQDDPQFTLWKVQHVVGELGKIALSLFFPVFARAAFYALFGARVGRQVAVAGKILDPRLTELGDGCVLGEGSIVSSHTMVHDRFVLRAVRVGAGATVGVGCILMPGVNIGTGAVLLPGAVVRAGTQIRAGETWGGVPAVLLKSAPE
jgi:acetyltransferase-like isoleucine patch superfamily enzyme